MAETVAQRGINRSAANLFAGSGSMAMLMGQMDWGKTPLGPVEAWPQSLRTAVSILLNSPFPMVIAWGPQLYTLYNDAYCSFVDGRHPHGFGLPLKDFWLEGWPVLEPSLTSVLETGNPADSEGVPLAIYQQENREERLINCSCSPLWNEQGQVSGVFVSCTETTPPGQSQVREVESPRSTVLAELEHTQLQRVHRNSLSLLKLVNTLLDFSCLEAGCMQPVYEPTPLATFTVELVGVFRAAIERAGLRLVVDCHPLPEPVYVDRDMWEKIVLNLLSNAFKFTFAGEISVRLRVLAENIEGEKAEGTETEQAVLSTSSCVVLEVRDTGIGIAPQHLPQLFDRSWQINDRTAEGVGLGLPLIQEFVQLHGGTIQVSSTPGIGSCFTVRLPLGTAHLPKAQLWQGEAPYVDDHRPIAPTMIYADTYGQEVTREPLAIPVPTAEQWSAVRSLENPLLNIQTEFGANRHGASLEATSPVPPARILVVDDNEDMRNYLCRLLSRRYQVEVASDGVAALRIIRELQPDLVVSDVMMPGTNGVELLRELRADPQLQELPVILLSAWAGEEARLKGLEAGADDYLIKPFSVRELLARVEANLKLAKLRREAAQREQELFNAAAVARERALHILEQVRDAFITMDADWRILYVNQATEEHTGMSFSELQGRTFFEIFPEARGSEVEQYCRQVIDEQVPLEFETYYQPYDRWYEMRAYPAEGGGLSLFARDITERKQYDQVLRQVAAGVATTTGDTFFPAFVQHLATTFQARYALVAEVNPKHSDQVCVLAYWAGDQLSPNLDYTLPGTPCERVVRQEQDYYCASGIQAEFPDAPLLAAMGAEGYLGMPLKNSEGEVIGHICIIHDLPLEMSNAGLAIFNIFAQRAEAELERKYAENDLRRSEEKFRQIAETIQDVFWMADVSGNLMYVSPAYEKIWGRSCDSLYADYSQWLDAIHPDDRERMRQAFDEQASRADFDEEYRVIQPNGTIRWVRDRVFPIRDEANQVQYITGIAEDISERKKMEEVIRQREEDLRLVTNAVPALIAYVDAEQRYRFNNQVYESWFGYSTGEMYGKTVQEVLGEGYEQVRPYIEQVLAGQAVTFEKVIRHQTQGYRYVSASYIPRFDAQGKVEGFVGLLSDITERKQAEDDLRQSEERLRLALQNSPITMFNQDLELRYTWVYNNPSWKYGMSETALLGKRDDELLSPEEAASLMAMKRQVIETGVGVREEFKSTMVGQDFYFDLTVEPLRDHHQTIIGITCAAIDITQRRRTEAALQESEQRFRRMADSAPVFIWMSGMDGFYTYFNQPWLEFVGQTLEEALANGWFEGMHPDDYQACLKTYIRACQAQQPFQIEYRHRRHDGQYRWLINHGVPLFNEDGSFVGYVGSGIDITDRRQAEAKQREDKERLTLALEAARMGTWDWNLQTNKIRCSLYHTSILGYKPNKTEMTYAEWVSRIHPEDLTLMEAYLESSRINHTDYECEYRVIWPDGTQRWVYALGRFHYNQIGHPFRMLGVMRDITDRKQAEAEREQILQSMMGANPVGMFLGDIYGNIRAANDAFLSMVNYSRTDLEAGQVRWIEMTPPEYLDLDAERITIARETGVSGLYEKEYIRADGTRVPVLVGYTLFDADRERSAAFILDLTERKRAEWEREQILERERAAREAAEAANRIKDEFLAVLSHELRSPLNPIMAWAKLLRTRKFSAEKIEIGLETIERNARLQTQLIEDLLDVSRILRGKLVLKVGQVDLRSVIEGALETVRLAAEAKEIQITTRLNTSVGLIRGDSSRLQQIVWNLLSNAVKFTPQGGRVEIQLERVNRLGQSVWEVTSSPSSSAQYARITVRDNGKGISPEFLPHVFEYFRQADSATTRKFGGLGLGLAIVRHLTELHAGSIQAESLGEEQGATFTVFFPLPAQTEVSSSSQDMSMLPLPSGLLADLQVLVVDDEADLRDLAVVILESYGAQVQVAASAMDALSVLDQTTPQVLVTDIGMPEMDGYMLIRQVRDRPPEKGGEIPAIALTAYAGEADQQQAMTAGFQLHVSKPVEPEEFVKAIAQVVGRL